MPILCVDLLILKEGKCLLLLRDNEPAKGQYWFPGGRVNKNELIAEACIRKAKEETGLTATFQKIISIEETIFPQNASMDTVAHTVNVVCLVKVEEIENIQVDHLHASYKWIDKVENSYHEGVKNPLKLIGF